MSDRNQNNKKTDFRVVAIFGICIAAFMLFLSIDLIRGIFSWIGSILSPAFLGIAMAFVINPLYSWLNKKFLALFTKRRTSTRTIRRTAKALSVILAVLFLLSIIVLLLFLIIPEFLKSLKILIDRIPGLVEDVSVWFETQRSSDSEFLNNFGNYIDTIINRFNEWLNNELSGAIEGILSFATSGVISVVAFLFDFIIATVVCVYALIEKNNFIAQTKKLILAFFSKECANDIFATARYANEVFGEFVSGKIITSALVGVITFLFMTVMGMPYALLSGVILGITNIIPFFGPFIGGVPTAFIVLITEPRQGIIYVIYMIVLQQVEGNIIEPAIMEDKTGVSKFWVTVALLFFGGMFGVGGMIISVPLFAVLFYIIKEIVNRKLTAKGFPTDGTKYISLGYVDCDTNEFLESKRETDQETFKKIKARVKELRQNRKEKKQKKKK